MQLLTMQPKAVSWSCLQGISLSLEYDDWCDWFPW